MQTENPGVPDPAAEKRSSDDPPADAEPVSMLEQTATPEEGTRHVTGAVKWLSGVDPDEVIGSLFKVAPEVAGVWRTKISEQEATQRIELEAVAKKVQAELDHQRAADERRERSARDAKTYDLEIREREAQLFVYEHQYALSSRLAWARTGIAAALVLGTIGAVFYGLIRHLPAGDLAQYLAPISGLAGLAVGYFFGRGSNATDADLPDLPDLPRRPRES